MRSAAAGTLIKGRNMTNIFAGMIAGLIATMFLSMMMIMKKAAGFMPQMDMIGMLSKVTDTPRPVDWIIHFLVGIFAYGLAMALLAPLLPGDYWIKGMIVGAIGWMIAMVTLMPAAGEGLFGLKIGPWLQSCR